MCNENSHLINKENPYNCFDFTYMYSLLTDVFNLEMTKEINVSINYSYNNNEQDLHRPLVLIFKYC